MGNQATGLPSGYDVRETADNGGAAAPAAPLAPTGSRTFTEGEAYAIVADNVQRETASKTEENETLKREKAELQAKLDTAEASAATEKAARETAETALTDERAKAEREKAAAERKDARVAKVRETAAHLKDDFFTDERQARFAAMEDTEFDSYIAELAELSKGVEAPKGTDGKDTTTTGAGGAPRETAMAGSSVGAGSSTQPKGLAGFAVAGGYQTPKGGN